MHLCASLWCSCHSWLPLRLQLGRLPHACVETCRPSALDSDSAAAACSRRGCHRSSSRQDCLSELARVARQLEALALAQRVERLDLCVVILCCTTPRTGRRTQTQRQRTHGGKITKTRRVACTNERTCCTRSALCAAVKSPTAPAGPWCATGADMVTTPAHVRLTLVPSLRADDKRSCLLCCNNNVVAQSTTGCDLEEPHSCDRVLRPPLATATAPARGAAEQRHCHVGGELRLLTASSSPAKFALAANWTLCVQLSLAPQVRRGVI